MDESKSWLWLSLCWAFSELHPHAPEIEIAHQVNAEDFKYILVIKQMILSKAPYSEYSCLMHFYLLFSLKPLDIEFMKRLHDKVNVIPLIAKADTLTPEECQLFKKQVFGI